MLKYDFYGICMRIYTSRQTLCCVTPHRLKTCVYLSFFIKIRMEKRFLSQRMGCFATACVANQHFSSLKDKLKVLNDRR
jgi:hypothetical protein